MSEKVPKNQISILGKTNLCPNCTQLSRFQDKEITLIWHYKFMPISHNRDGETNQFSTMIVVSTLEVSNLFGVFDRGARVEQMVCQKYLKFLQQMKAFDYKH